MGGTQLSVQEQIDFIVSNGQELDTLMKIGRGHNTYLQQWLKYIKSCKNRTVLFEFMLDRRIGIFDSKCILEIVEFFENSGDHNPEMQFKVPIFDYRYCNKIYLESIENLKKLIKALH